MIGKSILELLTHKATLVRFAKNGLVLRVKMGSVLKGLNKVNVNKALGTDGLHLRVLKELSSVIAVPLFIISKIL